MTPNAKAEDKLLGAFRTRDCPGNSIITLGGTGPNGTCQLPILESLGYDAVQKMKAVNCISGSTFGYFIYLAFYEGKIRVDNYLKYDKGTRILHEASMLKALYFFALGRRTRMSLYENERIKETVFHLFEEEFANKTLKEFNSNIVVWSYCSKDREFIKFTSKTYPDMKVWEAISASLSIRFIHNDFNYQSLKLSDPMFSPNFKNLMKILLRGGENHLFLNYKKTQNSRNVVFLKNQPVRAPSLFLLYDFISFTCNLRNPRVIRTHRENTDLMLNKTARE